MCPAEIPQPRSTSPTTIVMHSVHLFDIFWMFHALYATLEVQCWSRRATNNEGDALIASIPGSIRTFIDMCMFETHWCGIGTRKLCELSVVETCMCYSEE